MFVAKKKILLARYSCFTLLLSLLLKPNQCSESNSNGSYAPEQLVPTQRQSSFQTSSYIEAVWNEDEQCVGASSSDAQEPFEFDF